MHYPVDWTKEAIQRDHTELDDTNDERSTMKENTPNWTTPATKEAPRKKVLQIRRKKIHWIRRYQRRKYTNSTTPRPKKHHCRRKEAQQTVDATAKENCYLKKYRNKSVLVLWGVIDHLRHLYIRQSNLKDQWIFSE